MMESSLANAKQRIRSLHGQLVILDADLAALFGITSERLNTLVRERWSPVKKEFAFPVGPDELQDLQPGLANPGPGDDASVWLAYTEHGVLVAGAVLENADAVQQSIELVREFVARRESADTKRSAERRKWLH